MGEVGGKGLPYRTKAVDVLQGRDLSGTTSVVTGGSSGIGIEIVAALAHGGSRVIMAARDVSKGEQVAEEIRARGIKGEVMVMQLDLEDFTSIRAFAAQLLEREPQLDHVVFNAATSGAGGPGGKRRLTRHGLELCLGVNHVGHFVLGRELEPRLRAQTKPCRLVVVASDAHSWKGFDEEDLNWEKRKYSPVGATAASKLANVLYARQMAKRLQGTNASVFSLNPGPVKTPSFRHDPWYIRALVILFLPLFKSPQQGAAPSVYAATAPGLEDHSGGYISQRCQLVQPSQEALDDSLGERLWEATERIVDKVDQGSHESL